MKFSLLKIVFFTTAFCGLFADEKKPERKTLQGGNISLGLDSYRGIPTGSWSGSFGGVLDIDAFYGIENAWCRCGAKVGGSYALYDFDGRGLPIATTRANLQQQGFVTGALFAESVTPVGIAVSVAYDLMITDNFGLFALNPIIDQFRVKVGCLIYEHDEVGVWGTHYVMRDDTSISEIPVYFRALPQVNLFWTHFFKNKSHLTFWGGTPYGSSLMYESGRPGNYIFGVDFCARLAKRWSMKGFASYMAAHNGNFAERAANYASNVGFALTYTVWGDTMKAAPSIANNSNFLVDSNTNL